MDDRFHAIGLDFSGDGYFSELLVRTRIPEAAPDAPQWDVWEYALASAVHGDFRPMPRVVDVHANYSDYLLRYCACLLLEDAITDAALMALRQNVRAWRDPLLKIDACHIFATVGRLELVPLILDLFEPLRGLDEADTVTIRLSWMLEPELGDICLPEHTVTNRRYRELVLRRCEEVRQVVPDPRASVFLGEAFSVRQLARGMLRSLARGELPPEWRQRFEASSGIDCSSFYKERNLRPLRAAAVLEEFLEDPASGRYVEGARYFFGRRVP